MALNKVIMNGRLTADPVLKTIKEKSFLHFSIAVRKSKEHTDFFDCEAWGETADFIAKFFHKGDGIGVEGELRINEYEKEKIKYKSYAILTKNVFFPDGSKKG